MRENNRGKNALNVYITICTNTTNGQEQTQQMGKNKHNKWTRTNTTNRTRTNTTNGQEQIPQMGQQQTPHMDRIGMFIAVLIDGAMAAKMIQ